MVAGEAQAVVEYVNPAAYCRRFVLGKYMDGSGFSCLTYDKAELCDQCRSTQKLFIDESPTADASVKSATDKHYSLQHPEGPIPAIKRVKVDTNGPMRDRIAELLNVIINQYNGCALCALYGHNILHHSYDAHTICRDHDLTPSTLMDLATELSTSVNGSCHGCGLSLLILNGLSEHIPSRACIYAVSVRTICSDLFITGRLGLCMTNVDPEFLDPTDIKSFGRWLRVRPLGESVNNLTRILYNFAELNYINVDGSFSKSTPESEEGSFTITNWEDEARSILNEFTHGYYPQ
ncbi:hypothetical protein V1505DRAFT_144429 [Lipomyces doorenjongii]